jgi:hypothetical protein
MVLDLFLSESFNRNYLWDKLIATIWSGKSFKATRSGKWVDIVHLLIARATLQVTHL